MKEIITATMTMLMLSAFAPAQQIEIYEEELATFSIIARDPATGQLESA